MKDRNYLCAIGVVLAVTLATPVCVNAQSVPGANSTTVAPEPSASAAPPSATPTTGSFGSSPTVSPTASTSVPGVAGPLLESAPLTGPKSMVGVTLPAPPPADDFTQDSQLKMQADLHAAAQAEFEKQKRDEERNRKSYERAAGGLFPLSPEQIKAFMRRTEESDSAARPPSDGDVKAEVRINTLSLDPGSPPPQINLKSGYVTTINIVDATGEPWPILDVGVGGSFEVSPTRSGSQVVRVMPLAANAVGNISVMMKDLSTPIIFRLTTAGNSVDMRYDARIPKFGPGAKVPLINRPMLQAGGDEIISLLQNTPPKDARKLRISGLDARSIAWALNGHTYVRTPLTLLSPAWDASVSSEDGTTVYEIGDAPVLLMSDNGALIRAKLIRDSEHDR